MEKSVILKVGYAVVEVVADEKILNSDDLTRLFKNFIVDEKPEAKVIMRIDSTLVSPKNGGFLTSKGVFELKGNEFIAQADFLRASFNIDKNEGIAYFPGDDSWCRWVMLVYLRTIFAILLLDYDCLLIHASGVINEGKGYIFAGTNSTGKSTIVMKAQNEGMQILGDDCIGIDVKGHKLFSTPFKKEIELLESAFYACLFIDHGDEFSKIAISETQAVYLLMQNNHLFMYMGKKTTHFIGKIIKLSKLALKGTNAYILKSRLEDDIRVML